MKIILIFCTLFFAINSACYPDDCYYKCCDRSKKCAVSPSECHTYAKGHKQEDGS